MARKSYEDNGVLLSKKTLYSGDKIKVTYNGLLAQEGAQNIILHVGFGDMWDNSSYIPMNLEQGSFTTELDILECKSFGICFKDTADNWDNNSGENYLFSVSKKPVRKEKTVTVKASKANTKVKK